MATGGGQVIVSDECFRHAAEFFRSEELYDQEEDMRFHLIDLKYANRIKVSAEAMKIRSKFTHEVLSNIIPKLEICIPACVTPFLKIDKEMFASEIRSLTIMFLSLGVDLNTANSQEGMLKIQKIMETV